MSEWGIPNWRDQRDYGNTSTWHLWRWRWEFYRRRADLRKDYDDHAQACYERCLRTSEVVNDPTYNSNTILRPGDLRFSVAAPGCHEKYGYVNLPNPRTGDHSFFDLYPLYDSDEAISMTLPGESNWDGASIQFSDGKRTPLGPNDRIASNDLHHLNVKFDLRKPLAPQLKAAKSELEKWQKHFTGANPQKRRHPAKWLTYLRVLDARADGASWSEIASMLIATAATEQTARDTHRQATALCFNF